MTTRFDTRINRLRKNAEQLKMRVFIAMAGDYRLDTPAESHHTPGC